MFFFYSLSKENGIGIIKDPPVFGTTRPVDFYCEAPERVKRSGHFLKTRCVE